MKHIYIFIVILLFPFRVLSSDDLATMVEAKYSALKSWSADFDQTTFVEMLKQTLAKAGSIQVARPDKIRIAYATDPKKVYVSDGKKIWVYREDETTAHEFDKPQKVISREALSFLSGLKDLSALFDVVTDLKEPQEYLKIKNKALQKLFLIPKDSESAILKIALGVDPKDLTVKEAVLFNSSENVTHYAFKNVKFDEPYDEAVFKLPKEPVRKIIKK